jgi:ribosomal-protein-alanine N-acetyltransferase
MLPDASSLPTLVTERLALRWLTPADVPALYEIFSDPEVTRYWSSPPLSDLAAAEALLANIHESFEQRTLFQWGIARRTDDRVIGTCTLAGLTTAHRRAELGFALARRYWGSGYVAEALPALVRFAFDELGLHRLEADVDPRNLASIRALERLGFRREGYLRERYHVNGEVQDAILYGLLQPDWEEAQHGTDAGERLDHERAAGLNDPVSVKGVLLVGGRVVLLKNSRDEWELPGGRVDAGEDYAQALTREFAEELAIQVAVTRPIDSYPFEVIPGRRVRIVTYGCTLVGEFAPHVSGEHTEHCLWPVDRLSAIDLPEGYRRSVEKWANADD